jgi:uracil phosphoribosyltransferase
MADEPVVRTINHPGKEAMLAQIDHPLVDHWLTELRDVETGAARFRGLIRNLSAALFLEATQDLPLGGRRVRTPLAEFHGWQLASAPLLVPILRAGLGMVDGILEWVPEARVCHVGLYRDHETLEAISYYTPTVSGAEGCCAFVLDPMLATGGSAVATIGIVKQWGVERIKLLGILGAPPGVQRVAQAYPDVEIFLGALDKRLNDVGYIVPGLGDAGDRQFGG